MSVILIDGLKTVGFHNGILRIECVQAGPNGEERSSGTLLIPGNQAGQVLKVAGRGDAATRKASSRAAAGGLRQRIVLSRPRPNF